MRTRTAAALALGAVLSMTGCLGPRDYPSGMTSSRDMARYVSTQYSMKSISVSDTRSGEVLFSVEVPVGQELFIQFQRDQGDAEAGVPDLMRWQIAEKAGGHWPELENTMPCPAANSRKVTVEVHKAEAQAAAPAGQG